MRATLLVANGTIIAIEEVDEPNIGDAASGHLRLPGRTNDLFRRQDDCGELLKEPHPRTIAAGLTSITPLHTA